MYLSYNSNHSYHNIIVLSLVLTRQIKKIREKIIPLCLKIVTHIALLCHVTFYSENSFCHRIILLWPFINYVFNYDAICGLARFMARTYYVNYFIFRNSCVKLINQCVGCSTRLGCRAIMHHSKPSYALT